MKWLYILLLLTFTTNVESDSARFQIEPSEALEFLFRHSRSFLHPGKTKCEEQKREARKAYEEKCTVMGKRFCPQLLTWEKFQQWEVGGGYDSNRSPLPTTTAATRINTLRTHQTPLYTPATLRTYRTPMYQQPTTRRPIYRTPAYGDRFTTRDPDDD